MDRDIGTARGWSSWAHVEAASGDPVSDAADRRQRADLTGKTNGWKRNHRHFGSCALPIVVKMLEGILAGTDRSAVFSQVRPGWDRTTDRGIMSGTPTVRGVASGPLTWALVRCPVRSVMLDDGP